MAPIVAAFLAFFVYCFAVNSSSTNKEIVVCSGDAPKSIPNGKVAVVDPPTCTVYPSQRMNTTSPNPVLVNYR